VTEQTWNSLPEEERAALAELWRDELARGWIPSAADLAAGLEVVRWRRT
jgi:TRAP-type C4-dicarboxylate transport system substrate-binding protein